MQIKNYEGLTDGIINNEPYESVTQMQLINSNELKGEIIIRKLPDGFHPAMLSLSNSSQKIAVLTRPDGTPGIYDFMNGQGSVISSRIYTYPDFPAASFSQIGKAELSAEGIRYKNTINGYSGELPTDIIDIRSYEQVITKRAAGGLQLQASSVIVSERLGEIRTEIIGTYTFEGDQSFPYEYRIVHQPSFRITGTQNFEKGGFTSGELVIYMKQMLSCKCSNGLVSTV